MLNATLCASMGCFTGLVFTLLVPPGGIKGMVLDALLGAAGGLATAWFVSPISDTARDPDSLNVAAVMGAVVGSFVVVALIKAIRGK